MATLDTKYVNVGWLGFGAIYGYSSSFGDIGDTSGFTVTNVDLDGVYSGADVSQFIHNGADLLLDLTGNRANSGWAYVTVGGVQFNRTSATYSYISGTNVTRWQWASVSTPFGTTIGQEVVCIWDDGAAGIVSPSATEITLETQAINNATVSYDATFRINNPGSGGTYEYAIEQGDSTPDNWTAMPSDTASSVTVSFSRCAAPATIYAQARRSASDTSTIVSVAGYAFWPPANISVNNATIAESFTGSYSADIIGGYYPGSAYEAYAVADITGLASSQIVSQSIDRLAPYTGQQFEIPAAELPTAGTTKTYYLYAFRYNNSPDRGGAGVYIEGNSFTITRLAGIENTPVNRDHGNNPWVTRNTNPKITYAAPEPNTTIYVNAPGASLSARFTTGSAPQRGTFSSVAAEMYVSANKPVHFITQGAQHQITPTTLLGQKFAHYATRNTPADIWVWNPDASNTATITVYSTAVSNSGIYGTSSAVSGSATLAVAPQDGRLWSHGSLNTWILFTSDVPVVANAKGSSGDFFALSPMAQYVYKRRQGNSAIVEDGGTPSTNTAYRAFDSSGSAVQSIEIGDGAGGDAMQPVGDVNISNTYAFGDTLRDFAIVSPNNQKIVCEYYSGGSWNIGEYFEVTGASASNPVGILRSGNNGFYVNGTTSTTTVFNSAQIWRWRGEQPFFLGFNDSGTDEEANFGYTTSYVAPVINTITDNGGSPTATVTVTLSSNGSGGVLKYAQGDTSTPPQPQDSSGSSSWQTSNQFTQTEGDTKYYFVSQAENFSGAFDSQQYTVTAADNTPENYTNLAGDRLTAALNTTYYATFSTTLPGTSSPGTGLNLGTTIDNGTSLSITNGEYRINSGSFTSTPSSTTVNQNDVVYVRGTAASASGLSVQPALTIGTVGHSFLLKTGAGAGNNAGTSTGTDTYGVACFGPDGSTVVWGSNNRQTNLIVNDSTSYSSSFSSQTFSVQDANDNQKVVVSVGVPNPTSGPAVQRASDSVEVTKTSTNVTVRVTDFPLLDPKLTVRTLIARIG